MEEIKAVAEGHIFAQIISILHDRELGKKTKREMNTDVISSLKEHGVDIENPEKLVMFFIYLQEHHLGLYLLLKTLSYNLLMAVPEDCNDKVFSEEEFGMSKTDYGFLIRGINTILFLFEAIYHAEREGGGGITLYIWGMCKEILENTFETVAKMNGIHKDDFEFIPCLDRLKSKNKEWAFYLERIQEILSENETLDENVKYFQQWWNGKDNQKEHILNKTEKSQEKINNFDEVKNIPKQVEEPEDIQNLKRQQMEDLNNILQSLERKQNNKGLFGF